MLVTWEANLVIRGLELSVLLTPPPPLGRGEGLEIEVQSPKANNIVSHTYE